MPQLTSNEIRTKLLIFISNELNLINKRNKLLINSKVPSNESNNFEFTILERNIIKNNDIQYKQKTYNSVPKKFCYEEKNKTENNIENYIFSPIKNTEKIPISKNKNLLDHKNEININKITNSNVNNNNSILYSIDDEYKNKDEKIDKEKMTKYIKILRAFCFHLKKRKLNYNTSKSLRNKSDIIRRKKYSKKNNNLCNSTCVNVLKENLLKINYINSIISNDNNKTFDDINFDDDKLVFHNKKKKKKNNSSNMFSLYQNKNNNKNFINKNNIINLIQL